MSMLLEMQPESGQLNVNATGTFTLIEAKRTFVEMIEAVALHKTGSVLFDGRKLLGEPQTLERFYYGEFAAKTVNDFVGRGVSRATRFAYVLKEPLLDPRRLGETVAVNRGMTVKAFDNLEDALQWLGAAPAGPSGQ